MATTTRVLTAAVSGTVYTTNANDALEAIDTCHSGTTAPTDELVEGKLWMDTTASPGTLKVYSASAWQELGGGGLYQSIASTDITTPVATVEFDLDTTTYKEFRLRVRGLVNSANAQNSFVQFSPDDGVTWRTTGYSGHSIIGGTVASITGGLCIGAGTINVVAYGGSNADMTITVGSGTKKTQGFMVGHGVYYQTSSFFQGSGGLYNTAESHNKMRVIANTGNLQEGTIELMGELI